MEDRYLFKAKKIDDGEWIVGYLYRLSENNPPFIMLRKYGESYEVDEYTICQCTGLKDRNNNLIWENDILDGFTYPYMSDGVHNYYVKVCWCDNVPSFGIYTQKYPESKVAGISARMTELMEDWNQNDWEVIGNIFDNKELSRCYL